MGIERTLDKLKELMVIVISTPVKAGAIHRLKIDPSFESRLAEAVVTFKYIEEAFERGRGLAKGSLDSHTLGLGTLFGRAVRDAFEFTGRKPLVGLVYASLSLAVVAGYADVTGRGVLEEAGRIVRTVLYGNEPEDTVALVEGLEAVGASDYLLKLEKSNITKRSVRLNMLPIGDLAEKLQEVDEGFSYNIRGITRIRDLYSGLHNVRNLAEAIIKTYYRLGVARGLFTKNIPEDKIFGYMVKVEKEGKLGEEGNRLLGGVYLPVGFRHLEAGLALP